MCHYRKCCIEQSQAANHAQSMNRIRARTSTFTFLRTELQTGLTFAMIAEHATDEDKINRNREKARIACRSAQHFMGRIPLSDSESAELHEKLKGLEGRLHLLEKAV